MNHFAILMYFLRDRQKFLEEISKGIRLENKIVALLISSSVFFALYGAIIGSFSGGLQMVASAIKVPALYLITMGICLPTLYFFDVISGSKRSFGQYLALLLASMSIVGVMLFSFAPITLFFRLSVNDYQFFKLLNVLIFTITGLIGVNVFYRSLIYINEQDSESPRNRTAMIRGWLVLYGFVGSQLGWTLRPFFGTPDRPFELFRPLESNFYFHLLKVIAGALGFR
ncbi:actin-binding WH2 domain-containing protein [Coleofasciculus sp. FACHB-1120]|uniref:actin-binding WH2 domain-containing protein n=1 Tax=Coleofasciculus sp. FACHB-1120 TaxID=2692783 RepID=UPI001686BBF9|nr:actin-binding WH2 domain-containing protein [Coleofasciculus sp. FACHB-1120]MBD2742306.1 actin-binding WH2 domain-containing protein [Coleofasciculus sp. FACHB-1120]